MNDSNGSSETRPMTLSSGYEPWEETPIPISPLVLQKLSTVPFVTKEVSWEKFNECLPTIFTQGSLSSIRSAWEQIKFTIVDDASDILSKQMLETFLQWFLPFENVVTTTEEGNCVTLQQVAQIVRPSWFFGFVTAQKAKEILSSLAVGSYLVRFSLHNPRIYTLSVTYRMVDGRIDVGHWRIESCFNDGRHCFKFGQNYFPTLEEFIKQHSESGTEILLLSAHHNVPCVLKSPADRYDHPFPKVFASPLVSPPPYDRQSSMNFLQLPTVIPNPTNTLSPANNNHLTIPKSTTTSLNVTQSASNLSAPMPQFGFLSANSKQRSNPDLSAERAKIQLQQLGRDKESFEDDKKKLQKLQEDIEKEKEKLKEERAAFNEEKKKFEEEKRQFEERRLRGSSENQESALSSWLKSIGMERFQGKFLEEDIDFESLQYVNKEDLDRMDIKQIPARRLLDEISKLRQ